MKQSKLSVRVNRKNANHHLWDNNGKWWCHITVHKPDYTAERHRVPSTHPGHSGSPSTSGQALSRVDRRSLPKGGGSMKKYPGVDYSFLHQSYSVDKEVLQALLWNVKDAQRRPSQGDSNLRLGSRPRHANRLGLRLSPGI
jgi:hypothetical protein